MTIAVTVLGWALALGFALRALALRRRLELVACAAHELRGPATALGLIARAAGTGGVATSRHMRAFEAQLERMRAGLGDLDAARRGSRACARVEPIGIGALARSVADGWGPVAREAGRRLTLHLDPDAATVEADRGRLTQALGNLIDNAVEHGEGPIELRSRAEGERVLLEVSDEGSADRESESGPAICARRSTDRGRGLRIVRRAVRPAGGSVVLDSASRRTVASIDLPAADR